MVARHIRGALIVVAVAVVAGAAITSLTGRGAFDIKLPGPCEVQQQITYPGTDVPPPPTQRTVHRYNAQGQLVRVQTMLSATQIGETVRHEYDAAGNHTLEERTRHGPIHTQGADGTTQVKTDDVSRIRWTYDRDGRMLTRRFERDEPDSPPPHETFYRYDADGHPAGSHAAWEGKYTADTEVTLDASGRVITERHRGGRMGVKTYAYDGQGNVVRETDDADDDGHDERIVTRTYDADGLLTEEIETLGGGGGGGGAQEKRKHTWSYDDGGNPLRRHETLLDATDGSLEVVDTYRYECWTVRDAVAVDQRGWP